ncbi:MAG TPA: hypothetical protein VJ044_20620 [Candidatus Hodarchaeales archaeon]|nr:hypothetical protein [Candidatus Hodarchaeales archaeon]
MSIELDSVTEKDAKDHLILHAVWSISEDGTVSLRALCTTTSLANRYRKYVGSHEGIVRVWSERVVTDHLYGVSGFETMIYGQSIHSQIFRSTE